MEFWIFCLSGVAEQLKNRATSPVSISFLPVSEGSCVGLFNGAMRSMHFFSLYLSVQVYWSQKIGVGGSSGKAAKNNWEVMQLGLFWAVPLSWTAQNSSQSIWSYRDNSPCKLSWSSARWSYLNWTAQQSSPSSWSRGKYSPHRLC